jgi:hypothetical protein
MKKEEKAVHELVDWCSERMKVLSENDELAILQEFDEWILYENGEVTDFDFIAFSVKS